MILIIDNYDSFTYNLFQQVSSFEKHTIVKKNNHISLADIAKLKPAAIMISPGPGRPEDAGISEKVIEKYHKQIPILGVCLGHQAIARVFGARIVHAKKVMHGKTSEIIHANNGLFKNCPNPMTVARYHSLAIESAPDNFIIDAKARDGEIMAIRHNSFPLFGIQFHPESFMTRQGSNIIENFLKTYV